MGQIIKLWAEKNQLILGRGGLACIDSLLEEGNTFCLCQPRQRGGEGRVGEWDGFCARKKFTKIVWVVFESNYRNYSFLVLHPW